MLRLDGAYIPVSWSLPVGSRASRYGSLIANIRHASDRLRLRSDVELRSDADELRATVARQGVDAPAIRTSAFALMMEALRRTLGVELYDVQLQAALVLAAGRVAEMQTGEGKTLSCTPAACLHAMTGRGVHVVTPNHYLAQRDFEQLRPAYEMLGLRVGLLAERAPAADKRAAYQCEITYGPGFEFGFDYLRDQLALRSRSRARLGETLLRQISRGELEQPTTIQRELAFAIVDEVDDVLLDDAGSPLILSDASSEEATDAAVHRLAAETALTLMCGVEYTLDRSSGQIQLTAIGRERVHAANVAIPIHQLQRTWVEYVEQALRAKLLMYRDVHYVLRDGAVQIVDGSTGRIYSDRTWQDGLHQAIEAKEGLSITAEKSALAQITKQRFFRLYGRLSGMTGTAAGCEREFRHVYALRVEAVPLRVPSRRKILRTRFFADSASKWEAIRHEVQQIHFTGRPVLVGTRSIADSESLASQLAEVGVPLQVLNGRQDAEEADIVSRAGQPGAVTIATNLAGRGTDIRLPANVAERGGLHVIVAECHESSRIDRQLVGRCARQGEPGTAQLFVSADDSLIQRFGPWLARSMRRLVGDHGEVSADLTGQLQRIQEVAERTHYAARCAMLRRDLARDSLLSRRGSQP